MKFVFLMLGVCVLHGQAISEWAFGGADHRLQYRNDERGNSMMDFSSAGYRAGGVKLPSVAAGKRLTPTSGDNTGRIQAALDGATGAVELAAGEYEVAGTLRITKSGVVLRGERGTVVRLTGTPHCFLEIQGLGTWQEEGSPVPLLDAYVPAGSTGFRVRDASAFHAGDRVLVVHPVTDKWIQFLGIDKLIPDAPRTWMRAGSTIRTDRVVDSVKGDKVWVDVPLSDALDAQFTVASLVRYSFAGRITEVGVEGLRIVAPFEDVPAGQPQYTVLRMDAVEDGWARDLEIEETQNGIAIGPGAKRLTLTNVRIAHSAAHSDAGAPADFALQGTQILVDRCGTTGQGTWPVVAQAAAAGPLVILNFTADHGGVASRQAWVTGLLVDGGRFPGGTERRPGIAFGLNENCCVAWSVAWNVSSPFLLVQRPTGTLNWCTGCAGTPLPTGGADKGIFDSAGTMVVPSSLYLQQLRDRIGPEALRNIGYKDGIKLI